MTGPEDARARRAVPPVICYPPESLWRPEPGQLADILSSLRPGSEVMVPARDAKAFHVSAGQVFRISCCEGSQVGDLNLWSAGNLQERFFSGKTRALHGSHVSTGDRLWSTFPYLRPMATIIADSLEWYGIDAFGGGVHDVIGTRCDPYTHDLLTGGAYHYCCHSNLTRALVEETGLSVEDAEPLVHDVLNVFMCTGFTRDTGQYFMKASPVRPGDSIVFLAEIDLIGAISACPGGDCSATHSSDVAECHPLKVEILDAVKPADWPESLPSGYGRSHGL